MAVIIDGKMISRQLRSEIAEETAALTQKTGCIPGLAVIIVGKDPASEVYVRNKCRACEEVGFYSEKYELPEDTTEEELLRVIDRLNHDTKIHGFLSSFLCRDTWTAAACCWPSIPPKTWMRFTRIIQASSCRATLIFCLAPLPELWSFCKEVR